MALVHPRLHSERQSGVVPAIVEESSSFVGRTEELAEIGQALRAHRLVTLVGAPGIGKTRLALRFVQMRGPRATVFFDCVGARSADELARVVARGLGLESPEGSAARSAARALGADGGRLVVLDNLEQLLPTGVDPLGGWLDAAAELRILATSREPLGLAGEHVLEVSPLRTPSPDDSAEKTDAVRLFVDRIREARGVYEPSAEALQAIGEIVRQLGGLPLAIEIAASRGDATDPVRLLPRLWRRLELLPDRGDGRGRRAMTMAEAVSWSWSLLPDPEQRALRRCAIFRGGFDVQAALAVVDMGALDAELSVADVLAALRKKSLLRGGGETGRYDMYESVRTYAEWELSLAGERETAASRHAEHFDGVAMRFAAAGTTHRSTPRDGLDRGNLHALLEHAAASGAHRLALHAAIALDALSGGEGLTERDLGQLDVALAGVSPRDQTELAIVTKALGARAWTLRGLGRMAEAIRDARMALALAAELDDCLTRARLHQVLGAALFGLGAVPAALVEYEAALALARTEEDLSTEARLLQCIGGVHLTLGHASEARQKHEEALALAVQIGDAHAEVKASIGLGWYCLEYEHPESAALYYEHGLTLARSSGMARSVRVALGYLGMLHFDARRPDRARGRLHECLLAAQSAGDVQIEGLFRAVLGGVLASQGEPDDAAREFDASERLLDSNDFYDAVAKLFRGHLELALARRARDAGDGARAKELVAAAQERIALARKPPGSLAERSDDARVAIRILERAIASF